MTLLEVDSLCLSVNIEGVPIPVVQDISFTLQAGQTLGIVGESGCGKSLTALAIMGLLETSHVTVTHGAIYFHGQDLMSLSTRQRREIMGGQMAMIFQEPMTSLNPVYRIGEQIVEMLQQHQTMTRRAARQRAAELLSLVHIPDAEQQLLSYPHQLSGGMRQRVMIAMALACDPALLIADEPTTALDVTVQAQILDLLMELQERTGMAMVLISHDLGVIAQTCQHVSVMYRGQMVETASTVDLFDCARHPYTRALLQSIPSADQDTDHLDAIPGRVPMIHEKVNGCAFHPRCTRTAKRCETDSPLLTKPTGTHLVRCHHPFGDTLEDAG